MIGIPYARVEIDAQTGEPVQVCPECDALCPMRVDADGETTLSTYADHYEREHASVSS